MDGARLTIECDRPSAYTEPKARLDITAMAEQLSKLIGEEARAQVAQIDTELRALGVEPDPFEAAAPKAAKGKAAA